MRCELFVVSERAEFTIRNENGVFVVEGSWVENLVNSVNFSDEESFSYFQRSLRRKGVIDALEAKGVVEGTTVRMYELEFDYVK